MTTIDVMAANDLIVATGGDNAVLTISIATPKNARLSWGVVGDIHYLEPWKAPVRQDDGSYKTSWMLTGLQKNVGTSYDATVQWDDGSSSNATISWTQVGLGAVATDSVFFADQVDTAWAAIRDITGKAAAQGWLNVEEWRELNRLVLYTAWYNRVSWTDGR